jgi:hypothetical protein
VPELRLLPKERMLPVPALSPLAGVMHSQQVQALLNSTSQQVRPVLRER